MRRVLRVTVVAAIGLAVSFALLLYAWYSPRRPWSDTAMLGAYVAAPAITVIFAGRDLRAIRREIRAKRSLR